MLKLNKEQDFDKIEIFSGRSSESIIERFETKEKIMKFSQLVENAGFFIDQLKESRNIGYTEGLKSDIKKPLEQVVVLMRK